MAKQLNMAIVPDYLKEGIELWLKHKKEKNQTYKPTGFEMLIKKCIREYQTEEEFMAAVEHSVGLNYAGIYPDKSAPKKNPINQKIDANEYRDYN